MALATVIMADRATATMVAMGLLITVDTPRRTAMLPHTTAADMPAITVLGTASFVPHTGMDIQAGDVARSGRSAKSAPGLRIKRDQQLKVASRTLLFTLRGE